MGEGFPVPITLSTGNENIKKGQKIVLRETKNNIAALLEVEEVYTWNREEYATKVLGTLNLRHPVVAKINRWRKYNLDGKLRALHLPQRYDFHNLRLTLQQTREKLRAKFGSGRCFSSQKSPASRSRNNDDQRRD